jgi:protein SCO1/2
MSGTWSRLSLMLIVMLTIVSCGGAVATGQYQGIALEQPTEKPAFSLTDTNGEAYDFVARTEGRLTILYFGYLNCPDICPVHLAQIAETFDQLPAIARDAEVVFVSVDPERDSPSEIRDFLDRFDRRFVGLTGSAEELEVAQSAAGVPVARKVGEGDDYTVDHAGQVLVFAPDGRGYTVYPFGTRQTEWANDLQILAGMSG